ncbi:Rho GTPase, putative [Entamoeba invadens IP1]|uniref:small monomeric GTPase n=1 Tax=Entamoeba invadens IP1 TaxID=370355 RepID=L7FNB5_ENTIV|nr:Rho GTPase, putative [Entamoeba invadens IP1]ELP94492.1 Rho GTPase, putative [Entamoeba invadens IP1]|eukprot:XP_004261263.1 Rho GTPase, putative [Entamoeba invadens IP1]
MKVVKIVVVGDGAVGKTCILMSYTSHVFPETYVPTVFENYNTAMTVDNTDINLSLLDTAGQEEYDKLRPVSYSNASVFLLCFAVNSANSLDNIECKWKKEVVQYCPDTPCILVGTKCDLRENALSFEELKNEGRNFVSQQSAEEMAKKIEAVKYIECSALTQKNLSLLFEEAVRIFLNKKESPSKKKRFFKKTHGKKKCTIL